MTKQRDVVRFQVELTKAQMEEVEQLMRMAAVTTKKNFLNNAITIFKWAVDEKAKGNSILSISRRSDIPNRELLMPLLEAIAEDKIAEDREGRRNSPDSERQRTFVAGSAHAPTRYRRAATRPMVSKRELLDTGDRESLGDPINPRFTSPGRTAVNTLDGQVEKSTVTPFEKWLREQSPKGSAVDRSYASWRDYVRQTKETTEKSDVREAEGSTRQD